MICLFSRYAVYETLSSLEIVISEVPVFIPVAIYKMYTKYLGIYRYTTYLQNQRWCFSIKHVWPPTGVDIKILDKTWMLWVEWQIGNYGAQSWEIHTKDSHKSLEMTLKHAKFLLLLLFKKMTSIKMLDAFSYPRYPP